MTSAYYILIFYYIVWGVSVGFLMNKIAKVDLSLWLATIIAWPVMLPIAAVMLALVDAELKERLK